MDTELEKIAYVYGDICVRRKKQRRKRQKLLVTELMTDYAKNSTLHGLRYIVDHALNIFERFFWLITVIASLGICSFYIYNVVQKWITSPVIVTVNGRLSSVGSVPFPAVTLCPQLKVNPLNYNFTENHEMYRNDSLLYGSEEYVRFLHISSKCDDYIDSNFTRKLDNSSYVDDLIMASPDIADLFYMCKWQEGNTDDIFDCGKLFSRVITGDGVCFTANGLAAQDIFKDSIQNEYNYTDSHIPQHGWSLEDGYNYSSSNFFPKRGRVSASDPDLSIILINDPDLGDKDCNKLFSGYKIYLHHPADMPQTSQYYYAAIPKQLSSVAINFHEFNSDSGLANYDSKTRQCYFPKDRELRYFKIYTAKNCLAECLSNYTHGLCGCVGLEMPFHNSSKICFPSDENTNCMDKAQDYMAKQERMLDLGLIDTGCNCLPECNTVEYDAEILKTDFRFDVLIKKYSHFLGYNPNTTYSGIDLFFKKSQFVTMQRRELFGFTDLLANIGGLLGVFLGFSFLSLIEIIYFITVRVGFILKRDLEEEKNRDNNKTYDMKIK